MLFFECNADEALVTKLGCVRKKRSHLSGKSRVCKSLENCRAAVGMIDEDPGSVQPPYLSGLMQIDEQHDIRTCEDGPRNHRIVFLKPRLEEWLIRTANTSGLSLPDFGLSSQGNDLHREINSKIPNLEKLLDRLLALGDERLRHLKQALGP